MEGFTIVFFLSFPSTGEQIFCYNLPSQHHSFISSTNYFRDSLESSQPCWPGKKACIQSSLYLLKCNSNTLVLYPAFQKTFFCYLSSSVPIPRDLRRSWRHSLLCSLLWTLSTHSTHLAHRTPRNTYYTRLSVATHVMKSETFPNRQSRATAFHKNQSGQGRTRQKILETIKRTNLRIIGIEAEETQAKTQKIFTKISQK